MSPPKDWDAYGSTHRGSLPGRTFVDLRPLLVEVMPASLPAGLHFYNEENGGISSYAFVVKSHKVFGYTGVENAMHNIPGIHYLMYIEDVTSQSGIPDLWMARFATIPPESGRPYTHPFVEPKRPQHILSGRLRPQPSPDPLSDLVLASKEYPHRCPRCSGPAYVGFASVDCQRGCR